MEHTFETEAGARFAELADELLRLRGRLMSATRNCNAQRGLHSQAQGIVLTAVVRSVEPPTVARIARSLGLARQSVQRSANELAQAGYVRFEDNPHHKRAKQLVVTDAGHAMVARSNDARERWADQVGAAIGVDDLVQASATLRRIRQHLEQRERATAPTGES
ncbi:MAG: MarR family winged helix-turn-helix transcriptional regulator [Pseudomonadota bacterium]